MTLKEVAVGSTAKVKKITGAGPLRRRIMDMGITKGVEVYVRKVAPLGDPVELTVRGYELSIRKDEAEAIEVEFFKPILAVGQKEMEHFVLSVIEAEAVPSRMLVSLARIEILVRVAGKIAQTFQLVLHGV